MIPLWYQAKNGKWIRLTHFPDGEIGLTMQEAVAQEVCKGLGTGMSHLDANKFYFTTEAPLARFLLRQEK